jgi:hypothetical protein
MTKAIPKKHAEFIYFLSHTSLFSSVYAIANKHYDLALVPGLVFLSSINYWRDPVRGIRRTVDMITVFSTLVYQLYRCLSAENMALYLFIKILGMLCYPASVYFFDKDEDLSIIFHGFVHLFGNIANIVLYSGYV